MKYCKDEYVVVLPFDRAGQARLFKAPDGGLDGAYEKPASGELCEKCAARVASSIYEKSMPRIRWLGAIGLEYDPFDKDNENGVILHYYATQGEIEVETDGSEIVAFCDLPGSKGVIWPEINPRAAYFLNEISKRNIVEVILPF